MQRRSQPFLFTALILTLASLACQALSGSSVTDTPAAAPRQTDPPVAVIEETATEAAPALEPATVNSQGTGIACIGSTTGLSCLTDNGWQSYTDSNSDLPNNYLYAGTVCPDEKIAIAHINGVAIFDGASFTTIPELADAPSPDGIACATDGSIWLAHFQGVSHFVDGQWTTYSSDKLATGDSANELVYDVKVAPDGKVWVVTSQSVALFENDTWTVFQEGEGFDESRFFNALALDAKGRPWAAHSSGVDVYENGAWQTLDGLDYTSPESLTVDARGQGWLGTLTDGVYNFDGSTWSQYDQASEDLRSNHVTSLSADSSGRVWLGTSYGVTVFDGTEWQTYLMQNSGLADNDVEFVVTTKDGPALPALDEKETGTLSGALEAADGTPLAGTTVEICVETLASTFSGDTPCSDQPFFLSTTTDENGSFTFENVPTGYYVIVADTGDTWAQLTDQFGISSERTLIEDGEDYDIGTLTIQE